MISHTIEMPANAVEDLGSLANEMVVFRDTGFVFDAVKVNVE